MKVLHVNSYFNGSLFYKNLFDNQVEKGLDIKVFVPVSKDLEIPLYKMGKYTTVSRNHKKYDRFIFHLKTSKIFRDIKKKYYIQEFLLTHAHSLFINGYISMKIKKKYNIPYVVAVRNTDANVFFAKMPFLRSVGVKILKEASSIVFISTPYRDEVISKYIPKKLKEEISRKSIILPNGINNFWFENKGEVKKLENKSNIKLLYVGEISRNKNLTTTIKALKNLNEQGFQVQFTIVGKIKDIRIFNEVTKHCFVNYITPQSKENLLEIYRKNDIFIMPSIRETFGLVYAEAMSQGLPIIYTKSQGFDKQFNEGLVGYSVNCLEPNDISNKVIQIIEEYSTISNQCLKNVNKFYWDGITNKYIEVYEDIVSNKVDL